MVARRQTDRLRRIALWAHDSLEAARPRGEVWIVDATTLRERRLTYHCEFGRAVGTHLDDRIVDADGWVQQIRCGAGRDVVDADATDVVGRDCEVVRRR